MSGPSMQSAIEVAADSTYERSASPPSPSGVLTAMIAYSAPGTASAYEVVNARRLAFALRSTSSTSLPTSSTTSGRLVLRNAATGHPHAIASRHGRPKPSYRLGKTRQPAAE